MDALNFLPWRAQARQRRLRHWQLGLAVAVLGALVASGVVYLGLQQEVQAEQARLAQERQQSRGARQFARADELRAAIAERGYEVRDVPGGFKIVRIR